MAKLCLHLQILFAIHLFLPMLHCSAVAQLVEQETVNLLVTGSSPVRGAILNAYAHLQTYQTAHVRNTLGFRR